MKALKVFISINKRRVIRLQEDCGRRREGGRKEERRRSKVIREGFIRKKIVNFHNWGQGSSHIFFIFTTFVEWGLGGVRPKVVKFFTFL